jgi:predicted DNA-binding transcriptional regulator YafY
VKRLDRLLGIALLLSARRRLRAEALAAHFDVSLRTVYRDVRSLVEAGFPIVGTPGDGYVLPQASHLRPLAMEPAEAEALVMGARLLEQDADEPLRARLRTAVAKLEAVLPPDGIRRLRAGRTQVILGGAVRRTGPLGALLEAIVEKQVVRIVYRDTTRDIEPLGLVRIGNEWIVPSYCRLRDDLRAFRADRIISAEPTGETFQPRPGISLEAFADRGSRLLT